MNRLKRTLAAVTAALVCMTGTPAVLPELADTAMMMASAAEELTYGDLTYEVNYQGTISITGCDKSAEVVEIPAEIDGKAVKVIGLRAFEDCTSLTSITILESVTVIDMYAFSGCTSLTSITIPESVTMIGWHAFSNCTSLTSITIPESVTVIGKYAFSDCTSLTSITIPESVTEIPWSAFSRCTSLMSITLPESVTVIGGYAFSGCTSLTSITIPENVTEIDSSAFSGCTSLTSIQVDSGNENYTSEDGILFSKDKSVLVCCLGGKEGAYVIPESVTKIVFEAFSGCTSLTSITIPESVTEIGGWAFSGCTSLTSITIPESVPEIGWYVFSGCEELTDVYYIGTEEQWKAINIASGNVPLESATIHFKSTAPVEPDTPLGDINGDDTINASDAAVVLIAAALIGAGDDTGLTEAQRQAADVNKDGKINASDAAVILMYAAAVGAGDENAKIEDFIISAQ